MSSVQINNLLIEDYQEQKQKKKDAENSMKRDLETKKTKEGELEATPESGTADEAIERRRKERRDRRKTNSESSCTRVEIPANIIEDDAQVSMNIRNEQESLEANEDNSKQSRRRSKNRHSEKVESFADESETRMEGTDQSARAKPKVIVPSPQGNLYIYFRIPIEQIHVFIILKHNKIRIKCFLGIPRP